MNDRRFKELLNLFLDHELSEEDARELEAEVRRDPVRRQVYESYCRMQKGCTLLFQGERLRTPERPVLARAIAEARRKVEQPEPVAFWGRGWSYAAAAVAMVALVGVVIHYGPPAQDGNGGEFAVTTTPGGDATGAATQLVDLRANGSPITVLSIAPTLVLATSGAEYGQLRTTTAARWLDDEHTEWARPQPFAGRASDSRAAWEREFAARPTRTNTHHTSADHFGGFRAELTGFGSAR